MVIILLGVVVGKLILFSINWSNICLWSDL
jgi:hypothetical protein